MDRTVASVSLLVAAPAILAKAAMTYIRTGHVFEPRTVIGRGGRPFRIWTFAGEEEESRILHLVAVARGHMRFVGPRPLSAEDLHKLGPEHRWRLEGHPGVFSAHRLRRRTGIAYDEEHDADRHLIEDQSLTNRANLGLIARSVVADVISGNADHHEPDTIAMLDVAIANTTMSEALDWIFERTQDGTGRPGRADRPDVPDRPGHGSLVCFVNPGSLNTAVVTPDYRAVLHGADLVLPDGIGLKVATRMKGVGLRENVNGTDMFPRLCERAAELGTPLYLLGARDGVAEAAARAMRSHYPDLIVAGTHHGYLDGEEDAVIDEINASGAQILLVAMGVPHQELWLQQNRDRLSPAVLLGVGGLFDFYSGRIPRAPLWLREIGMEWAWRLLQEPRRMWKRYIIGNPLFLYRVWRDRTATTHQTPTTAATDLVDRLDERFARRTAGTRRPGRRARARRHVHQ